METNKIYLGNNLDLEVQAKLKVKEILDTKTPEQIENLMTKMPTDILDTFIMYAFELTSEKGDRMVGRKK